MYIWNVRIIDKLRKVQDFLFSQTALKVWNTIASKWKQTGSTKMAAFSLDIQKYENWHFFYCDGEFSFHWQCIRSEIVTKHFLNRFIDFFLSSKIGKKNHFILYAFTKGTEQCAVTSLPMFFGRARNSSNSDTLDHKRPKTRFRVPECSLWNTKWLWK